MFTDILFGGSGACLRLHVNASSCAYEAVKPVVRSVDAPSVMGLLCRTALPRPHLFEKQRSQEGVQCLANMFNQDRDAIPHTGLQLVAVARLALLHDLHPCCGLHGLHPGISLSLRIQHEWGTLAVPCADGILDGGIVCWETPEQPLPQLYQQLKQVNMLRTNWAWYGQGSIFKPSSGP